MTDLARAKERLGRFADDAERIGGDMLSGSDLDLLRALIAAVTAVEALADQWNSTPDYSPTDYDRGRVDQRHDMTGQLLEALADG